MTAFIKEKFQWDGMYLMYNGPYEGSKTVDEVYPDCHPSKVGLQNPAFIARFKWGSKPYKSWINFLVKNATVEQYLELANHRNRFYSEKYGYEVHGSPVSAMEMLGFKPRKKKKAL